MIILKTFAENKEVEKEKRLGQELDEIFSHLKVNLRKEVEEIRKYRNEGIMEISLRWN
jgi:hypothetical protein